MSMLNKINNNDYIIDNKVNLHEMIHIDKVESILNTILSRLDKQDIDIQQLQNTCGIFVSRSTFER